ncbi:polyprotein [Elysia marginata]|uniref:Polyprotein n=1 Tax=Elysia marginata TaxID=1093978 RepID=A0AAV4J1B1_9GAST|nr:polyprotein [Elysia marginata]
MSPKEKSFTDICKLLTEHFNPTPPKFVQRKKFEERIRLPTETVQEFLVALKKLAEFCQFGNNLNERLLDRFVMGVNNEAVQKKLLQEDKLTIDKALSISQSMIESSKGAKSFKSSSPMCLHYTHRPAPRARTVPFSQKEGIERELERLEREGVIEKVTFSDWASPVVPIPKSTGQTRLCGDYKNTVNPVLKGDKYYPLPTKDDLLLKLQGGKRFTEIDLSNAYNQIALDEQSKMYTTINTHKGLYQYNRLVFGISSAPSIFQRTLECLLQDIDNCVCYIDNIYLTGKTDKEHLQTLEKVLFRLETSGLRVRKEKCSFMKPDISFLGYQLTSERVKPQKDKLLAIQAAHPPQSVQQLRAFLGMMKYYGSFIPNLSSELTVLYALLEQKQAWQWTQKHQACFVKAKKLLTSDKLLVHFDPDKPIVLSCDASPYGLGAVLSHIMSDGREQPIAFASRTLMPAEKNYSQIDKEGLALTFRVKKFHKFIYGRPVVIYTDHKPLLGLLGENKPIPQTASARVIRWALTLSA